MPAPNSPEHSRGEPTKQTWVLVPRPSDPRGIHDVKDAYKLSPEDDRRFRSIEIGDNSAGGTRALQFGWRERFRLKMWRAVDHMVIPAKEGQLSRMHKTVLVGLFAGAAVTLAYDQLSQAVSRASEEVCFQPTTPPGTNSNASIGRFSVGQAFPGQPQIFYGGPDPECESATNTTSAPDAEQIVVHSESDVAKQPSDAQVEIPAPS